MAVAIISYNTRAQLAACLESIDPGQRGAEILVVDNGSDDGSVEMVRTNYPWASVYLSRANRGYGAAANLAIARCQAPYVLLLNSDTLLEPKTLPELTAYLDRNPRAGIAGPRLVNPDGSLQISCYPFPSPVNELLRWTSLGLLTQAVPGLRERYLPTSAHSHERRVDWVVGAALAIRRQAFEAVSGFDESFFMYSEEVDLCYRMAQAGWETHFTPATNVVHLGGASTARYRAAMAARLFASLEHFYRRHYSVGYQLGLRFVLTYLMMRNLARDSLRRRRVASADERAGLDQDLTAWRQILSGVWRQW